MSDRQLRILTSNRLERLAERLAETLAEEPLPPLDPDIIIVQSPGMRRWLGLELARRHGIAACLDMPFPHNFCYGLAENLLNRDTSVGAGSVAARKQREQSDFGRSLLVWRIFSDMRSWPDRPEMAVPAAYLDDDGDGRRRYQLARRIADLFDDYQLYRPGMLRDWESARDLAGNAAEHARWQRTLWQRLVASSTEEHLGSRFHRLIEHLHHAARSPAGLPARISVFGVSTLPPVFLDLLAALARFIPVSIYFVSPTFEYWGDVLSEREAAHRRRRLPAVDAGVERLAVEAAPPLLASMGRLGRELFGLLQTTDVDGSAWHELPFDDAAEESPARALHVVQSDILHMRRRGGDAEAPVALEPNDDSIGVHVCHSPFREMEVLRDLIVDAFDRDSTLRPDDVIVLVPDIAQYAPYVDAVFGTEESGYPRVPYSIADRFAPDAHEPVNAFQRVLALTTSRVTAADVLGLLDLAVVARRFGIADDEVPVLREWTRAAGVRWGIDAEQRQREIGVAGMVATSWRAGLDRLLMGYATGEIDALVANVAPCGQAAAADADLLGRFATFADVLFGELGRLVDARRPARWLSDLTRTMSRLIAPAGEDEEASLDRLRDALAELRSAEERGALKEPVSLEIVREHLDATLAADTLGSGFISGRITFCALKPMRTIPFRMICMAGLNEGAFPRRDRSLGFDLMRTSPASGDRSLRADDRYLFLETLLSAGDRIVLTYEGLSEQDGSMRAPSIVVEELLDTVDCTFRLADCRRARERVVVQHGLQPFDRRYFDRNDDRLFSYSHRHRDVAALGELARAPRPFADRPLAADDEREVALTDLVEFWVNPCKSYARDVLRLRPETGDEEIPDAERFALEPLDSYQLATWLVARRLRGEATEAGAEAALLHARGLLPFGEVGRAVYAKLRTEADAFVGTIPAHRQLGPLHIELDLAEARVIGVVEDLTDVGLLRYRVASCKPKDLLRAWILYLAAAAAGHRTNATGNLRATVVAGDGTTILETADAKEVLESLITGYRQGRREPLPVFERASFAYAEQLEAAARSSRRSMVDPLARAREKWKEDAADPHVALCMRDRDPLAEDAAPFRSWAERLWRPILAAKKELDA